MPLRRVSVVGILMLALPITAAAAVRPAGVSSATKEVVPFVTVSAGASTKHPRRNRLYLARTLAATDRWRRWLGPRTRNALRKVDFDRYGVLVVFRLQQSTGVEITRIVHAAPNLLLALSVPPSPPPDPTIVTVGAYHLVAIKRRYLRNVSRLVVTAETVR